jgi:predicted  nucleic acid-binding Zn-ribbon protein
MSDPIVVTCPKCGKLYRLGQDGVITGCDACMGVVRDGRGFAWAPGQVFEVDVEKRTIVQIVRPKGG